MAKKKKKAEEVGLAVNPSSDEDWKVSSALDTLIRSEEICQDPDLLKKVKALAKKKKKAFSSLDQVIAYKNERYGSKEKEYDEAEKDEE